MLYDDTTAAVRTTHVYRGQQDAQDNATVEDNDVLTTKLVVRLPLSKHKGKFGNS